VLEETLHKRDGSGDPSDPQGRRGALLAQLAKVKGELAARTQEARAHEQAAERAEQQLRAVQAEAARAAEGLVQQGQSSGAPPAARVAALERDNAALVDFVAEARQERERLEAGAAESAAEARRLRTQLEEAVDRAAAEAARHETAEQQAKVLGERTGAL